MSHPIDSISPFNGDIIQPVQSHPQTKADKWFEDGAAIVNVEIVGTRVEIGDAASDEMIAQMRRNDEGVRRPQGRNRKQNPQAEHAPFNRKRRMTMKKQTLMIVAAVGFLIALSAVSAFAQTRNPVSPKFPSTSSVNNKTLLLPENTPSRKSATNGCDHCRSADEKVAAASLAA
jgi:hypothetical protein